MVRTKRKPMDGVARKATAPAKAVIKPGDIVHPRGAEPIVDPDEIEIVEANGEPIKPFRRRKGSGLTLVLIIIALAAVYLAYRSFFRP